MSTYITMNIAKNADATKIYVKFLLKTPGVRPTFGQLFSVQTLVINKAFYMSELMKQV